MSEHPIPEITAYRERQNPPLSTRALGALVGTSAATISRIETGARRPSPELARLISRETGIPLNVLRPDVYEAAQ